MYIGQVMKDTANDYGATYIFFDQSWYITVQRETDEGTVVVTPRGNEGLCVTLAARWLKSSHKRGFFIHSTKGIMNSDITDSKSRLGVIDRRQVILGKVGRISNTGDVQKHYSIINEFMRKLRGQKKGKDEIEGAGTLSLQPKRPLVELGGISYLISKRGSAGVVSDILDNLKDLGVNDAALIHMRFKGKQNGHAIAVARSKDEIMIFDPNGGIMCFKKVENFYGWFGEEFSKADESNYNNLWTAAVQLYCLVATLADEQLRSKIIG